MSVTAEVMQSSFDNGRSGWYVKIKFIRGSRSMDAVAQGEARKNGYDPDGEADIGADIRHGISTYTRAYWFFDRKRER